MAKAILAKTADPGPGTDQRTETAKADLQPRDPPAPDNASQGSVSEPVGDVDMADQVEPPEADKPDNSPLVRETRASPELQSK